MPQEIIPEYNLNIYTMWTKWSLCSKCNAIGKKIRYGYCTLSSHEQIIKKNVIKEKQLEDYKRQSTFFLLLINIYIRKSKITLIYNIIIFSYR